MSRPKIDRTGEIGYNNDGERMVIIRYGGALDIDIQFEDGTIIKNRQYVNFKKGNIKNPMTPIIHGVGFIGVGDYKTCDENGKLTKCHNIWVNMLTRCYSSKYHEKYPTYENCKVCEEWHNFQVFAKWQNENYYEVGNERMELDKDILNKGNKVYSPNTCIFVPHSINVLFTKCDKARGKYPIGVYKKGNKFRAKLSKSNGKQIYLGYFNTPEEAFQAYKQAKEDYIKEVANEYKLLIPQKLYDALMNYEVNIDD